MYQENGLVGNLKHKNLSKTKLNTFIFIEIIKIKWYYIFKYIDKGQDKLSKF